MTVLQDASLPSEWGPVRTALQNHFTFSDIKEICSLGGLDMSSVAHLNQRAGGGASKGQLMSGIDAALSRMDDLERQRFTAIVTEEVVSRKTTVAASLEEHLARLGLALHGNTILPVEILDPFDASHLPQPSQSDIEKAGRRLRDGDLSGAVTSACSAVDAFTATIFARHSLGDPGQASFQERISRSAKALRVFERCEDDLRAIGWATKVTETVGSLRKALNHGAYLMQTLRSAMGDVHGTKPVLNTLVFDSIKWAQVILRILSTNERGTEQSPPAYPVGRADAPHGSAEA